MNDERKHRCALFLHATTTFRDPSWRPRADVLRTRAGWLVKLDLAGVRREDLELWVDGNRLIVRGTRRDTGFEEGSLSHLMEIPYSRFERVIEVPHAAPQDPEIRLVDGMLLIRILAEVPRS